MLDKGAGTDRETDTGVGAGKDNCAGTVQVQVTLKVLV